MGSPFGTTSLIAAGYPPDAIKVLAGCIIVGKESTG